MQAKWWAFGLWAAVAAVAGFWGLKLAVRPLPVPAQAQVVAAAVAPQGDLTRLLGADAVAAAPEAPPASARFQLVGVVAPQVPGDAGVAVIAIDGRTPKTFRVGAVVEGDTVLQSVAQRGAQLGPRGGAATVALSVAALPPAATGQLPALSAGDAPQAMPAQALRPNLQPPRVFAQPAPPPQPVNLQPPQERDNPQGPERVPGGLPTQ